jgi:hypothetical protein
MRHAGKKLSRGGSSSLGWLKDWPVWQGNNLVGGKGFLNNPADAAALSARNPIVGQHLSKCEDGIYVDVSYKDNQMTLGFVVVVDSRVVQTFSTGSDRKSCDHAEREAIEIALKLDPKMLVFCDCGQAVDSINRKKPIPGRERVRHIDRKYNNQAHGTAKRRRNYGPVPALKHRSH